MKIFAFILSAYVLYLTAIPCIDVPFDNSIQKTEISQTTNHENHQSDTDHCSPFCTCQCCQTNFYISEIIATSANAELKMSYNDFSSNFQNIDIFEFLIPPKS
ncbi:MAG: DUF6660 family protein [Bacteroidales bacterium]